jgi:hypothetical protein
MSQPDHLDRSRVRAPLFHASGHLILALFFGATGACTATVDGSPVSAFTGGAGGTAGTSPGAGAEPGAAAGGTSGTAGTAGSAGAGTGGTSGNATGGGPPSGTGGGGGTTPAADPNAAGPMPLRHLTSREYRNTVLSLVNDRSLAEDDVPNETSDSTFDYFPFRRPGTVGVVEAESLQLAAEAVAKNVAANVAAILPCQPATADAEAPCARSFIEAFGRKAYRRPLTTAEVTSLQALYDEGRTTLALDFPGAIALLVEGILQSPALYYLDHRGSGPTEIDPNGNVAKLDPYAVASRLAYFFLGSPPDDALLATAENRGLATADDVANAARTLVADARAKDMAADFADDLLDLDILLARGKDPDVYPSYGPALQEAMREEVQRYAGAVLSGASPTFEALLTSTSTFVNQPLATLYGVAGGGETFVAATLPAGQRGGLLTLAGFLANTGSADGSVPPRRGKFVYSRMLCSELPPPPNQIPAVTPPMPGLTTRARFEQHDKNPCATGCHSILDGLGFAFEHYDGIGAYRATEQGAEVDSTSSYAFDDVNPTDFADAVELGRVLAGEPLAQACFAKQWLRYALRREEVVADTSSLDSAVATFRAGGGNVPELWVALASSRTFRYRALQSDEVLP